MTWIVRGNLVGSNKNQVLAKFEHVNDAEMWAWDHKGDFENMTVLDDIVLPTVIEERKDA